MIEPHIENTRPTNILWAITNKCGLRCKHCFINAGDFIENELSWMQIKKIADEIIRSEAFLVTLSGGDPLLANNIFILADYLKNKGLYLFLETNGESVLKCLDRIEEYFSVIQLTAISNQEDIYDIFVSKKGAFSNFHRATMELNNRGIHVVHNYIYDRESKKNICSYLRAYSPIVSGIKISPLEAYGRAKLLQDRCLSFSDIADMTVNIIELKKIFPKIAMHLPYCRLINEDYSNICGAGKRLKHISVILVNYILVKKC